MTNPANSSRSLSRTLADCFDLPNAVWWRLFLIVLTWKAAAVLLFGLSYEMDTATYLLHTFPYHHPPLYSWLLFLTGQVTASIHAIALLQTTIFSLAVALTLCRFFRSSAMRYGMAVLLAIEPTSTFFCGNLMSECLFASLLLLWFAFFSRYLWEQNRAAQWWLLAMLALTGAALYATRLAAIFLVPFFVLAGLVWVRNRPRLILHTVVLVVLMELFLAPVKFTYLQRYESYSLGMFTGTNLWNSSSVLYPESSVRTHPETEFEQFMARRGVEEFSTVNALDGNTIHGPDCGYEAFMEQRMLSWAERRAIEQSLVTTSISMILENPVGYWRGFVWPNLLKPLMVDEEIPISPRVADLMRQRFDYSQEKNVRYSRASWRAFSILAVLLSGLSLVRRFRVGTVVLIVTLTWYYWLVHGAVAAISLRYLLVLAPLLLIAAGLQATALYRRVKPAQAGGTR